MVKMPVQGVMNLRQLFIVVEKYGLRHIRVLRRHGNQFFIIEWNAEVLSQSDSQFSASAAKLTAYCNDFIHHVPPLPLVCSNSVYTTYITTYLRKFIVFPFFLLPNFPLSDRIFWIVSKEQVYEYFKC